MIFISEQLFFVKKVQGFLSFLPKEFLCFFNFFDSDLFALLLITFIWCVSSTKWAIRLSFLFTIDAYINYVAKISLALPRPFVFDPSLAMASTTTKFGCPSGGAEFSFWLGALLFYYGASRLAQLGGIFYALIVAISRIALGVHFPLDVLGGWVLGFIVFLCFKNFVEKGELLAKEYPNRALIGSIGCCLILSYFIPTSTSIKFMLMLGSFSLGLYISSKMRSLQAENIKDIRRPLIGGFFCLTIYLFYELASSYSGVPYLPEIKAVFLPLWISVGVPFALFRRKTLFS